MARLSNRRDSRALSFRKRIVAITAILSCLPSRLMSNEQLWPDDLFWLVSYPNSGLGYTSYITESISMTTMATNYGTELGDKFHEIPDLSRTDNGPFRITNKPFPPAILTKTHCTGYCLDCGPEMYIKDKHDFIRGCSSGHFPTNDPGSSEISRYDPKLVKKVVHLIRDPFDNIVARFHHEMRDAQNPLSVDRGGFLTWCEESDERFTRQNGSWNGREGMSRINESQTSLLPCLGVFYQYLRFHNSVFEMVDELGVPGHVIHYKDYRDDISGAVRDLFRFIELPIIGSFVPFTFKEYPEYFTAEEKLAISSFIKVFSARKTWNEIDRYAPDAQMKELFAPVTAVPQIPKIRDIDNWCMTKEPCICKDQTKPVPTRRSTLHEENVKNALAKRNLDVVFYGDSITKLWKNPLVAEDTFKKFFTKGGGGEFDGLPLGIGGDKTSDLLWRVQSGEMPLTLKPKVIWLFIGTNDFGIAKCSKEMVLLGILNIIQFMQQRAPGTYLVVNAIFPRATGGERGKLGGVWSNIQYVNGKLLQYGTSHSKLVYVDFGDLFIQHMDDGDYINTQYMEDFLHPNSIGYELYAQRIVEVLRQLIRIE